jgi:hypothetical protein
MKALVALDEYVDRGIVETLLTSSPHLDVDDFVDLATHEPNEDGSGDVLIVACTNYTASVGAYMSDAARLHAGRPIVLVCLAATNGYIGEAIGAGADDILTLSPDSDLEAARAPCGP